MDDSGDFSLFFPEYDNSSDEEMFKASQQMEANYSLERFLQSTQSDDDLLEIGCGQELQENHQTTLLNPAATVEPSTTCVYNVSRFKEPLSAKELVQMSIERIPQTTRNKTLWAITLFEEFMKHRQTTTSDDVFCKQHLELSDCELNTVLVRFITEVKKADGTEYPGRTLREIIIGIQKNYEMNGSIKKLLTETRFKGLQDTLDYEMKHRAGMGIGVNKKQACIISLEQEDLLWSKGIIGINNPRALLDALIYVFGLNFALRGGDEHRRLRAVNSQIHLKTSKSGQRYLEYVEDVSKTNSGGLYSKAGRKITQAYENANNQDRCPVRLFQLYNLKCPTDRPPGAFYLKPKPAAVINPTTNDIWYCAIPVGKYTLTHTVSRLCRTAGFFGFYTNHSLRATAATRLYDAGVDEQLICEKTGHRSDAVRSYKRTSDEQLQSVSSIVQGEKAATKTTSTCSRAEDYAGVDEQLICENTGHRSDAARSYKRTSDEQLQSVSSIVQGKKAATETTSTCSRAEDYQISVNVCVNINKTA